ncbi:MAG TPA: apolipoprotein N-acyltransferase [Candidatus Eisenbacteria bacterium]|nr:apolipoprotein N-acyltransferase [Candidatus Eisenbacteria bacterium]
MIVFAAAVLSAVLYAAAVPPWSLDVLAPVALVPLLLALRGRRMLAGFGVGLVFGLTFAAATTWWVPGMLERFFLLSETSAVLGAGGIYLAVAGLPFALFGYGATRLLVEGRRPLAYAGIPALWVAVELARANAFTGLPWELLGHAFYRRLALIQVAELTGVYGLSFLCAWTALATADLLRPLGAGRRPAITALTVAGLLWLGLAGYGAWRLAAFSTPHGTSMPVALVQANRGPARQPSRLRRTETLEAYLRLTRSGLAGRRPELIVWPENTASFYLDRDAEPLGALRSLSDETGSVILVGGPRQDDAAGTMHNAAYAIGRDGVLGSYDKMRLVPFAEYAPAGLDALAGPTATFAPGFEAIPVPHPRGPLGVLICYEVLHADVARELVRRGAELLVNISNDAWADPDGAAEATQTFSMAVFRAVETRRWVLRAATTGISGFIAPTGLVGPVLGAGVADVLPADVTPLSGVTPYVVVGDLFAEACVLAALVATRAGRRLA